MNSFVYVIYNVKTLETVDVFINEDTCIECFNKYFNYPEFDWKAINLKDNLNNTKKTTSKNEVG